MFLIGLRRELEIAPVFPDPIHAYDVPRGYEQIRRAFSRALRHSDLFSISHWREPPEVGDGLRQAVTARQAIGDLPPITSLRDGAWTLRPGTVSGRSPRAPGISLSMSTAREWSGRCC
jgi:DNA (cytosine-5)-methyltransferase 1